MCWGVGIVVIISILQIKQSKLGWKHRNRLPLPSSGYTSLSYSPWKDTQAIAGLWYGGGYDGQVPACLPVWQQEHLVASVPSDVGEEDGQEIGAG